MCDSSSIVWCAIHTFNFMYMQNAQLEIYYTKITEITFSL